MALTSPRFLGDARLQTASRNDPAMNWGEVGPAVQLVQQALIELGFLMPITTQRFGGPDGIFGDETKSTVAAFQQHHGLAGDGIVGQATLTKLNQLLPKAGKPLAPLPASSLLRFRFRITFRSGAMPVIPESVALRTRERCTGNTASALMKGRA